MAFHNDSARLHITSDTIWNEETRMFHILDEKLVSEGEDGPFFAVISKLMYFRGCYHEYACLRLTETDSNELYVDMIKSEHETECAKETYGYDVQDRDVIVQGKFKRVDMDAAEGLSQVTKYFLNIEIK